MNQSLSLITNKNNKNIMKILDNFRNYLLTINTGRITSHLIDNIYIKDNNRRNKISHIASITIQKNVIIIKPWSKDNIKLIEKAILESSVKYFPNNNGKEISIIVPQLTKDDRSRIFKDLKIYGEKLKIAVRQLRRDDNNAIKKYTKNNKLPPSIDKKYLNIIQKQTDNGIRNIDKYIEDKKNNIMNL